MSRLRSLAQISLLALLAVLLLVPQTAAAVGISGNRAVAGKATQRPNTDPSKETGGRKEILLATTKSPANGAILSGSIVWEVSVSGGTPSRVEFSIDGEKRWSESSAPFVFGGDGEQLDTTTLANGQHTLSATAFGSKGVKSTTTVLVTVSNQEPAPEPTPEPAPEAPTGGGGNPVLWGATIGSHLTGGQAPWDMEAVATFEANAGKRLSLVQFFQPFAQCSGGSCSFYPFPTTPLENVRKHGAIPVLSWSSQSIPSSTNEPDFQLSDVIEGRYDAYIRSFATRSRDWGHPFFLRFNWEMNGRWFPWGEGTNGNKAGEFVASWRHVHDIFEEVGADNVTWVWCPNVDYENDLGKMQSQYPGDAYVDWTGLDGYNRGTNPAQPEGWKSFDQVFRSSYRYIVETVAPSKPMMIGEIASSEYGGSKATWTGDTLARIPAQYPKIRALLWFDKYDSGMDWPVETSSSSIGAFAAGIQNSAYLEGSFADLPPTEILPIG